MPGLTGINMTLTVVMFMTKPMTKLHFKTPHELFQWNIQKPLIWFLESLSVISPFLQVQLQPVVHYFLINLNLVQKTQPHCHGTEFIISYFVHKPRDKTRILTLSSSVFIF